MSQPWSIDVDTDLIDEVARRREALGAQFPRIALFLFGGSDAEALSATLLRIPEPATRWIEELVIVRDADRELSESGAAALRERASQRSLRVFFLRQPRRLGVGGARKTAFEYALQRSFDFVVTMRGDGVHPPETLPALVHHVVVGKRHLAIASRIHRLQERPPGLPLARMLAHRLATGLQNRLLGLRLEDYHSSYRVYPVHALRRLPFQLNANDRRFDMQILIQARALGLPIEEIPVPPTWQEYSTGARGLREVLAACAEAVDYRLHQLHVTRRGRYFVDRGVHYTLKRSPTGSHMQIVDAIAPGSRVLDLGCSQGLLARPLSEKGVRVVGVDAAAAEDTTLADELEAYHTRNLEEPLDLPVGRDFDYVVISDVIEHLRARDELLRGARRFLKEGGRLVVSTPNVALWFYRLSLLAGRFEYGARGVLDETHVHLFTRATFRREIERAGYHVLRERVTALPFEVVFESTGRSRLVRSIAAIYHALARLWPTMFAYQMILEAEITNFTPWGPDPGSRSGASSGGSEGALEALQEAADHAVGEARVSANE